MIKLRQGFTEDIRCDRIQQFDDRSRKYSIGTATARKLRSYTWRCHSELDQGREGACVGFAITNELIANPSAVQSAGTDFARELYYAAQRIDPWDGGEYPKASPKYPGTSLLAGVKVAHKIGFFDEYRWAFTVNDFFYGLGHNGPSVIGVPWYEGMYQTDEKGFIRPTGELLGGHCILVTAINVRHGYVTLHNSWGPTWGVGGRAYMTLKDIAKVLMCNGEAVFFMKRHSIPQ